MSLMVEIDNEASNHVQEHGPAIFLPHEAIGNVVTKTNTLIVEHRGWLDNLRLEREKISTTTTTTAELSLITPAPSFEARYGRRQIVVPADCTAISSSLASQLSLQDSTCQIRITSLSSALINAESAFASVQLSAAIALSAAVVSANTVISVSASVASSSVIAAQASASSSVSLAISSASLSASSAIASAQSSAQVAIGLAQSSASVSIQSAMNALTSAQLSASSLVASASFVASSASSAASSAKATASSAIVSAQASVLAAQKSATATRIAAMNTTVLALAITFSVIGSALITFLLYYLISRCRRRRRLRQQNELKERIHRVRHESDESLGPTLSAFPMPVGRSKWMSRAERGSGSRPETAQISGGTNGMLSGSATLMGVQSQMGSAPLRRADGRDGRQTWAPNGGLVQGRGGGLTRGDMDFAFGDSQSGDGRKTWAVNPDGRRKETGPNENGSMKSVMTRKNTLTYDPEHPERPPKFTTWLEESFRSVSPFPDMDGGEKAKKRRSSIFGSRWRESGGLAEILNGRSDGMGEGMGKRKSRMSLMQRRRSRSMGEVSDIGTAF